MYFQVMVDCIPELTMCNRMVVVPYDSNDYEILVRSPRPLFSLLYLVVIYFLGMQ